MTNERNFDFLQNLEFKVIIGNETFRYSNYCSFADGYLRSRYFSEDFIGVDKVTLTAFNQEGEVSSFDYHTLEDAFFMYLSCLASYTYLFTIKTKII